MNLKAENLRPWARRCPRLALASVYLALPLLFFGCVLYAFLGACEAFREEWPESFSDVWPYTKRWITEAKETLRQEIISRQGASGKEVKK